MSMLCPDVCQAQTDVIYNQASYTVDHYTDDNGLPQNSIKNMAADADGFIWLSTEKGLARFDGHRFYTFDKSSLPVSRNNFFALTRRMVPVEKDQKSPEFTLSAGLIEGAAYRIKRGRVVSDSAYLNKILGHIKARFRSLDSVDPFFGYAGFTPEVSIIPLTNAGESFFRCEREKVAYFSNWKKKYEVPFKSGKKEGFFLAGNKLFYGEGDGILTHIGQTARTKYTIVGDILLNEAYATGKKKFRLFWRAANDQVLLYLDKNLYEIKETRLGEMTTRLILEDFDVEANDIKQIYHDKLHHRFFLGTSNNGLFVMTKKPFETITSGKKGIDNVIYAQTLFGNSGILTPTGQLFEKDKKNGTGSLKVLPVIQKSNNNDKYSILTDKNGYIWNRFGESLFRYNASGDQLLNTWTIKGHELTQLYEGFGGEIWIGTRKSVLFLMESKGSDMKEKQPRQVTKLVGSSNISYIIQESRKVLWVGTSLGLYKVNPDHGTSQIVTGTEKMYIRSIYIEKGSSSEVWFTTYEDGFFLYKDGKLVKFPLDKKKYLSSSHCMVVDNNGFFWIPTNHGLFQIAKRDLLTYAKQPFDLYYHYYDKNQGFRTNEFNGGCQPCAISLPDGRLSLPSLDGIVWFAPEKITPEMPVQRLLVDRYEANETIKSLENDTIDVPLSAEQLSVYFTIPYFGNIANLNITYALVKFKGDLSKANWMSVGNGENVINLGSIKPGKYHLYIRKNNGFGINNQSITMITIIVPEHWYETSWFNLLSVLLAFLFIFCYIKLRMRYLTKKNLKLEEIIQSRTSELQNALDALQISEKELFRQMHIYSRLVASMSHDVNTPLRLAKYLFAKMASLLQTKDYTTAEEIAVSIQSSLDTVLQLVDNLTNYIKTQLYSTELKMERVNLKRLVTDKINLFDIAIRNNGNTVNDELPVFLTVVSHTHLLSILLHNLLDNANKHIRSGIIRIYAENRNGLLHLIIADSGEGMPEDLIVWLNTDVADDSIEESRKLSEQYQGLGLIIVREMCTLLKIKLFVEVKNGTLMHLIFREERKEE